MRRKRFAVFLEHGVQFVRDLLGDVAADFLHIGILLQVRTAYVQGDVRRVNDPVEQRQEIGDDVLYVVRNEDLVRVEVNLVTSQFHFLLQLREVEDSSQVEREVHVQVDVEERIFEVHRIEILVELRIVFVLQIGWSLAPKRCCGIDHPRHLRFNLLDVSVFVLFTAGVIVPFRACAVDYFDRHELAILGKDALNAGIFQEFGAIIRNVQYDVRTAFCFLDRINGVGRRTVATPFDRGGVFSLTPCDDVHVLRHHKGRVEAQPEVTNDGRFSFFALVFIEELRCS